MGTLRPGITTGSTHAGIGIPQTRCLEQGEPTSIRSSTEKYILTNKKKKRVISSRSRGDLDLNSHIHDCDMVCSHLARSDVYH